MSKFKLFIPITKVDAEKRLVYGTITEEKLDKSGEIMDFALSKPRFEAWSDGFRKATDGKSAGNLRVMHGSKVAGRFDTVEFDDVAKSVQGVAKVVDDEEWNKVLEGCYTGFSVGGSYGKRIKEGAVMRYEALPSEVSLVDNPCVHGATFELVRAGGVVELHKFQNELPAAETTVEETEEQKLEKKARELCKAAGFDPEEVLTEKTDKAPAIVKWHGFVEDARRDLAAPGSVDLNPGLVQKWTTPDGKTFEKKEEAVAHMNAQKVEKRVDEIVAPAKAAMSALDKALDKAEGKQEDKTPGELKFEALTKDDKAKLAKSTGLDDNGLEAFVKGAEPEVVDLILGKKEFSTDKRDKLADEGKALPDGSFPIENVSDLKNAVRAYGRAKDKAKAKAHIVARAKALKATDELPSDWEGSSAKKGVIIGALSKGMYTVSRLASMIEDLNWLRESVKAEAVMEGDNSPVPGKLDADIASLCSTLCAMCEEESSELAMRGMDPEDVSMMEDVLAASFSPRGLNALAKLLSDAKYEPLVKAVTKVATRHDAETMGHIQAAHDSVAKAAGGASCSDMSKVAPRDQARLQKAHEALKECGADCDSNMGKSAPAGDGTASLSKAESIALQKTVNELTESLTKAVSRIEHLEAQPVAEKGFRRGLSKQDDGRSESGIGDDDGANLTVEERLAKVISEIPEAERPMAMMKAAMRNGRVLAQ